MGVVACTVYDHKFVVVIIARDAMAVYEYDFNTSTSGKIKKSGLGYTATTGSANCLIDFSSFTNAETRAFFQFDTSDLDADGITTGDITKVEFYYQEALNQGIGTPSGYVFYSGDIVGATLNGVVAEFNGGSIGNTFSHPITNSTWIDIGGTSNINVTGTTDIKIVGQYGGGGYKSRNYNTAKTFCRLRITTLDASSVKDVINGTGIIPFKR